MTDTAEFTQDREAPERALAISAHPDNRDRTAPSWTFVITQTPESTPHD